MTNPILFIAPYDGLHQRAAGVIADNGYPVDLLLGNMEAIDYLSEQVERRQPDVVISRGGTYRLLRERFAIPVVETKISAFDILTACEGINTVAGPIGFLGFVNVVYGMDVLEKVLNRKVHFINLKKSASVAVVQEHVGRLAQLGVRYFVGDTISSRVANEMGYIGRVVESNEKTIQQAIEEALHLRDVKLKERMLAERYKVIIDATDGGIVSADKLSDTLLLNKAARVFCTTQNITPERLVEIMDLKTDRVSSGTEIRKINNDCAITVHKSTMELDGKRFGTVATFRHIAQIQRIEEKIRTELSAKGLVAKYTFADIIYESAAMEKAVNTARKFSQSEATVLIQAATGTGKELFAQSIHNASRRASRPFVAINCAALPENLLESELFGHEDGAFTGAKKGGRSGLFELAHGGTIFLDEIGDMPLSLQARLLRVIQEKEVMRLGGEQIIPVDVRVVASTNVDLQESAMDGKFREDLYFRLNVLSLRIPPLSERQQDVIPLTRKLMLETAAGNNKTILGLESDAMEALLDHDYRGNVRELRGIIERAVVIADTPYLTRENLGLGGARRVSERRSLQTLELDHMEKVLAECNFNYSQAARALGVDRSTLYRKLGAKRR